MAANAIFAKKGVDIVLLDVEGIFLLTDVFVIATGMSRPHVQSLSDNVEEKMRDLRGMKAIRREGRNEGEWVLLDFGDIIVHVFQATSREFYGLERLWADAEEVEWVEPAVAEG